MNSDTGHILSAFDRDLEGIQTLILKMGGLVEEQILDAARSLEERDVDLAEAVRARDKQVDQLEEQVNTATARLLALRSPTAKDLRLVLGVMKIAGNLERIGDYAKNMAKRTGILVTMPAIESTAGTLRRMAKAVALLLKDGLDAYVQHDVELARAVWTRDEEIDQIYNAMFREFVTHMMEDPRNITACMHLHFIAKNLERAGDHVTAIAEQVIYMVSGKLPHDERPKKDKTSIDAG